MVELGAGGCVVRHGSVGTPARLTTNGVGRTTVSVGWVLRALWLDTVRRVTGPAHHERGLRTAVGQLAQFEVVDDRGMKGGGLIELR